MARTPVVSLRVFLALLIGLLALVALGFAAADLWRNYQLSQQVAVLVERNQLADHCLKSVSNFALERGRANVALRAPGAIAPENRRFIDTHREAADIHIAQVLDVVPAYAQVKGEEVRVAWERVRALRGDADRDMALPVALRDRMLQPRWWSESDQLINRLETLLSTVSSHGGDVDVLFDRLAALRVQALHFRILVGRQSTLIGGYLSSGQLPGNEALRTVHDRRGQIEQIWRTLESGGEALEDAAVFQHVAWAQSRVFWVLLPMQDEFLRAAEAGTLPPMQIDRYLAAAVEALNATVSLADSINRRADSHAQRLLDQARWRMTISLAAIVLVLALTALVAWRFARRFSQPLGEVMARIDALLKTQSATTGTRVSRENDELGRVQQALEVLEEAVAVRMKTEAALRESEGANASILACVPQGIIATNLDGVISVFSPGAERMLGYAADEVIGRRTPLDFHDPEELRERSETLSHESGKTITPGIDTFMKCMRLFGEPDESEWTYVRQDGGRLIVMLAVTFLRDTAGTVLGCLIVATDVTERAEAVARISEMAYHDHLTQLPNSRLLYDRMQMAMLQSRRDGRRLAVMQIDLDRFKPVNDTYGHAVGDRLLKDVAVRMQSCLRESDTLARTGGDEFVVVLPGIGCDQDALLVARKIHQRLNEPFALEGGPEVSIACCIGVAIFPEHGTDEKRLQKCADEAMYLAKANGRNCVTLYGSVPQGGPDSLDGSEVALVRLAWHQAFMCGEPGIDKEHRGLFDHANRVLGVMAQKDLGPARLRQLLDQLIGDVQVHFAHEERILRAIGYEGLSEHLDQHAELIGHMQALHRRALAGEMTIGDLATFVVQEVVFQHILNEDTAYFSPLRSTMHQQKIRLDQHADA